MSSRLAIRAPSADAVAGIFGNLMSGLTAHSEATAPPVLKVTAAVMYAGTSLFIVFANKLLFQSQGFSSYTFVALCQYVTTAIVLWIRNRRSIAARTSASIQHRNVKARQGAVPDGRTGGRPHHAKSYGSTPPIPMMAGSITGLGVPPAADSTSGGSGALYPPASWETFRAVMPLPLIFFANTVSGLGATKHLNVPMFVLLRRFSIVLTLMFEMYLLSNKFSPLVRFSVLLMIVSAVVAAYGDIDLDLTGYWLILLNDVFTALQGVVLRKKLDEGQRRKDAQPKRSSPEVDESSLRNKDAPVVMSGPAMPLPTTAGDPPVPSEDVVSETSSDDGSAPPGVTFTSKRAVTVSAPCVPTATHGSPSSETPASIRQRALAADSLMFYNALCSVPLGLLLFLSRPSEVAEVLAFGGWHRPSFLFCFASSMFLGFAMNYSYFLCTKMNSPLTTTVIGSMKNVLSTYVGMLLDISYHFAWINFIGINLSVIATGLYSYEEIRKVRERLAQQRAQQVSLV